MSKPITPSNLELAVLLLLTAAVVVVGFWQASIFAIVAGLVLMIGCMVVIVARHRSVTKPPKG